MNNKTISQTEVDKIPLEEIKMSKKEVWQISIAFIILAIILVSLMIIFPKQVKDGNCLEEVGVKLCESNGTTYKGLCPGCHPFKVYYNCIHNDIIISRSFSSSVVGNCTYYDRLYEKVWLDDNRKV